MNKPDIICPKCGKPHSAFLKDKCPYGCADNSKTPMGCSKCVNCPCPHDNAPAPKKEITRQEYTKEKIIKGENKPFVNKKYFVEECDIFYSHFDHDTLGWFDNLEEAKELCDKKAKDAYYFYVYS